MNKKEEYQEIYINLDDSGKLTRKEKVTVYAGLVFLSKEEKDKFITQYRKIINEIKCHYCKVEKCNKKCTEIKNTNIKPKHKRRIMNYIKSYFSIALIIDNNKVYDYIINNKASKGRYIDYTIRRLIINIDEQSTKSNGYYNLKDGLTEELLHGISNFNYDTFYNKVLYGKLEIVLSYQDSGKSYLVQAADLIADTTRRKVKDNIENKNNISDNLDFIDYKIIFP